MRLVRPRREFESRTPAKRVRFLADPDTIIECEEQYAPPEKYGFKSIGFSENEIFDVVEYANVEDVACLFDPSSKLVESDFGSTSQPTASPNAEPRTFVSVFHFVCARRPQPSKTRLADVVLGTFVAVFLLSVLGRDFDNFFYESVIGRFLRTESVVRNLDMISSDAHAASSSSLLYFAKDVLTTQFPHTMERTTRSTWPIKSLPQLDAAFELVSLLIVDLFDSFAAALARRSTQLIAGCIVVAQCSGAGATGMLAATIDVGRLLTLHLLLLRTLFARIAFTHFFVLHTTLRLVVVGRQRNPVLKGFSKPLERSTRFLATLMFVCSAFSFPTTLTYYLMYEALWTSVFLLQRTLCVVVVLSAAAQAAPDDEFDSAGLRSSTSKVNVVWMEENQSFLVVRERPSTFKALVEWATGAWEAGRRSLPWELRTWQRMG